MAQLDLIRRAVSLCSDRGHWAPRPLNVGLPRSPGFEWGSFQVFGASATPPTNPLYPPSPGLDLRRLDARVSRYLGNFVIVWRGLRLEVAEAALSLATPRTTTNLRPSEGSNPQLSLSIPRRSCERRFLY